MSVGFPLCLQPRVHLGCEWVGLLRRACLSHSASQRRSGECSVLCDRLLLFYLLFMLREDADGLLR